MEQVCVAFKAHLGWVNTVAVRRGAAEPDGIAVARLELGADGDRETAEPYHVAGGWQGLERVAPPADPAAVVRRGRRRQVRAATRALTAHREALASAGRSWTRAVLLTTRGLSIADDLAHALDSHAHIHVAEGEAIRDATRQALAALHVDFVEQDEKSVLAAAATALRRADPDAWLKGARPEGTRTWRKEERLLALAAWLRDRS